MTKSLSSLKQPSSFLSVLVFYAVASSGGWLSRLEAAPASHYDTTCQYQDLRTPLPVWISGGGGVSPRTGGGRRAKVLQRLPSRRVRKGLGQRTKGLPIREVRMTPKQTNTSNTQQIPFLSHILQYVFRAHTRLSSIRRLSLPAYPLAVVNRHEH